MTFSYEVRQISGEQEMADALELRHEVFCVEQGDGIHLAVLRDGMLQGTCRLLMVGTTAQFSRLAVRSSARRRGIGRALLDAAEAESRAAGAQRLVLHAQTYARELYENAGYRPHGRVFREAGIEHIAMEKRLD
jgi:predicted GNAT family N-acyltransferase